MSPRKLSDIEKEVKKENFNIEPDFGQSVIIFVGFFALALIVMTLIEFL